MLIKLIKLFGLRANVGLQAGPAALFSWVGDITDIGTPISVLAPVLEIQYRCELPVSENRPW